jgi:16S rRNA (cytidine1402-2'-O)-methyltransferase
MNVQVYLIPTVLSEEAIDSIPAYVLQAIQTCSALYVENERTSRRFLRKLSKDIVIDYYKWVSIGKAEDPVLVEFQKDLREGRVVGILSEAGCPGIADPGQLLVRAAQEGGYTVRPLVGPSSILLGLMASGMNGQLFRFNGYLPIDSEERGKTIRRLETEAHLTGCTQIFIETPYRNKALLDAFLKHCRGDTHLCIARDITGPAESIRTKTISEWKKEVPDLQKVPTLFLLGE